MERGELASLTLRELEALVAVTAPEEGMLERLETDRRKGARALGHRLRRRWTRTWTEAERVRRLLDRESALCPVGLRFVAGVDEAGRGALAGPVLAAAVILPPGLILDGLDDSKRLRPLDREALAAQIREQAVAVAIGAAPVKEIERLNVFHASGLAMLRALAGLTPPPQFALIDGRAPRYLKLPHQGIIGGDREVRAIAAASIIAKVERDRRMAALEARYPGYGFARHKGYGTRAHREAILRHGPTPQHRARFLLKLQQLRLEV